MQRRFRVHDRRQVQDLSGVWDFAFLGDSELGEVSPASVDFNDRMAVPGCFDATPAYAGRRGLAAYRVRALVRDTSRHRLVLDGVHHVCRVFADGRLIGEHLGGFTRFACDFIPAAAGEVDLVVLVDNRLGYERCPLHLEYFDWYHFGGIARGAELQRLGSCWIDTVAVETLDYERRRLRVALEWAADDAPGDAVLEILVGGDRLVEESVSLTGERGRLSCEIELKGAELWSPEEPNLHLLEARLGDDDLRERFGIRQIVAKGRDILINDNPVRLLGFCRHEAHPQFGHALPMAQLMADVQLLRDMNCNFVRGSHYAQDVRFLDLCDEAGICVWNESIGWQHDAAHLCDPRFVELQKAHIAEMIAASRNRPCVLMWGILNESMSSDPACRPAYEELLNHIRRLDSTRPLTYASNHPFDDVCFDLADVISVNTYPGWYGGELPGIPEALDKIAARLDEIGQGDKPFIVSEIGAGAIYGWRDAHGARWTESYQARLLDCVLRHLFLDRDRACGIAIWQFCDCRTSESPRIALGRPRDFNNKGVVDEYRRPKEAYAVVKRWFGQLRRTGG